MSLEAPVRITIASAPAAPSHAASDGPMKPRTIPAIAANPGAATADRAMLVSAMAVLQSLAGPRRQMGDSAPLGRGSARRPVRTFLPYAGAPQQGNSLPLGGFAVGYRSAIPLD